MNQAQKGRLVDALVYIGDEGRGRLTKSCGEVSSTCDPQISEWGNPLHLQYFLLNK
jgi:hypothetical protein